MSKGCSIQSLSHMLKLTPIHFICIDMEKSSAKGDNSCFLRKMHRHNPKKKSAFQILND